MNAVDTNVFVYAFDSSEPAKRVKAVELLDGLAPEPRETVLLWQVAGEFLACLRRWEADGRITSDDVRANFDDVLKMFPLRLPSPAILDRAFDLYRRYSLSHWDSMLLAACKDTGVDELFSEDLTAGAEYDGVRVINPFA